MRSLSGGLLAAQRAASASPYVKVSAILGGGQWDFTTENGYLYSVEHTEEPYGSEAVIRLKNDGGFFNGKNLTGFEIHIGYGFGSEYSTAAPLWVFAQDDISIEGQLITELHCIDIFHKMSWHGMGVDTETGRPGAPIGWNRALTISEIIAIILVDLDPDVSFTADSLDGIANVFKPLYKTQTNLPVRTVIRDMIVMTKSGLRMDSSKVMHLLYLDPGEGPVYTYDSAHAHLSNIRQKALTIPNHVLYVDHFPVDDTDSYQYFGEAKDAESIARIGDVPIAKCPSENQGIQSDDEAQQMAEAILHRLKAEALQGRIIVPHNCGQELYDPIQVQDSRSGITFSGRVGGLIHRYQCGEAQGEDHPYTLEIRLGGLVDALSSKHLGGLPDRMIGSLSGLSLIHDWPMIGKGGGGAITPSDLPSGMQSWSSDLIFYPGDSTHVNKHNAVHWHGGTISWPDGRTITVNAGQVTAIPIGQRLYIYWDLTVADPQNLRSTYNLSDTLHPQRGLLVSVSASIPGGIVTIYVYAPGVQQVGGLPPGVVVTESLVDEAVKTAKLGNNSVVTAKVAQNAIKTGNLDNLAVTTAKMQYAMVTKDILAPLAVTNEKIAVGAIYGNVVAAQGIAADHIAAGAISVDKLAANAVVADLVAGRTILADLLMANVIRGGMIDAHTITADKLDVGELAAITANLGIVTAGGIKSYWAGGSVYWQGGIYFTRADNPNVGWGWVGDVGNIGGLGVFSIRSSGNIPLLIACGAGGAVFTAPGDQWGPMSDGPGTWIFRTRNISGSTKVSHIFEPTDDTYGWIGSEGRRWGLVRCAYLKAENVVYRNLATFDRYDDIELIKNIRSKAGVVDPDSLPPEVSEGGWVNAGAMQGLMIGALKQVINRLERGGL